MSNEPPGQIASSPDPPRFRRVALLPLASFAAVHVLQVTLYNLLDLGRRIEGLPALHGGGTKAELADLARRLEHGLSGLALALAWCALLALAVHTIWHFLQGRRRLVYLGGGGGLAVALFAWSLSVNPLTLPALRPSLDAYFELRGIDGTLLLHLPNALIIAVAVLLATAVSALLVPALATTSPHRLRLYQLRLRALLYTAAVALVAGVVHVRTLHHLPTSFLGENATDLAAAAHGLALSTGALWTLLLLTIYLPAALLLSENGRELGRAAGAEKNGELKDWLHAHGLDSTPLQQLLRLGAALAPFVAGSQAFEVLKLFGAG